MMLSVAEEKKGQVTGELHGRTHAEVLRVFPSGNQASASDAVTTLKVYRT
jgi:hypothetical protein